MALSTQQIAQQMLSQLRRLDPSISAEVGTPERKIIDTVAQALSDSQVDVNALEAGLDLDSKFGDNLDRFLALFGHARQKATYAVGFVTFSRSTPAPANIVVPANQMVQAEIDNEETSSVINFFTTSTVTLSQGSTEVIAPVRAQIAGSSGNVAANKIVRIVGTTSLPGITNVTNDLETKGGINRESDDEFKVRFRNTVFRNMAGTRDQFLALAVATQYSLKASVIGPQSVWREYIQVPNVDDSLSDGQGLAGEWTSALVSLPYAKHIWTTLPAFVTNGKSGIETYFYRPDTDFRMNTSDAARLRGDTRRIWASGGTPAISSLTNRPNFTFLTVVPSSSPAVIQAFRPKDIVLVEFQYLSDASRNNPAQSIYNAVDVYVDGGNTQFANNVLTAPTSANVLVDNATSKHHYENYRRIGEPEVRPLLGNYLMPLAFQPVTDVPSLITVGDNTYTKGTHYWAIEDVSELGGSVRGRAGIEWSATVKGTSSGTPRLITEWIGGNFLPITVSDYSFDRNIMDLQTALESNKQITTDVLAHKATTRYFKLDVTVMYSPGSNPTEVNAEIRTAVDTYLRSQYFGSVIQLSDLLQVIHNVIGVDNVRWSSDYPGSNDKLRAVECDITGRPLLDLKSAHVIVGAAGTNARQRLFLTGDPAKALDGNDSTFSLSYGNTYLDVVTLNDIPLNGTVTEQLQSIFNGQLGNALTTVTEDVRSTTGVRYPIRSWTVQWNAVGARSLINASALNLLGGRTQIYTDFILRDNELAALPTGLFTGTVTVNGQDATDTVPGLIIRTRAQNTFLG